MLSNRAALVALTTIAPVAWGTTYLTTTTFLPPGHPLLIATVRALPAGLILLLAARRLPSGSWWWRSWVLGALNFTAFFGYLFVAADRLPGGVAAVVGGIQPLLVAVLGWRILSERLPVVTVLAGAAGVVGVGLIVAPGGAALDPVGVAAALGGAVSMAVGTVLTKRWGSGQPPLAMTAWQLLAGGLLLAVLTAFVEPLPDALPTATEVGAYAYLTLIGTALAYVLWFRGVRSLPTRLPAFVGLLSPVVAVLLGLIVAGETLSTLQALGLVAVLASVTAAVAQPRPKTPRVPPVGLEPTLKRF
ncbi:EamA family transporter [Microbacterium sp. Yaish 1]|uniref:EamA family transporter n=1 Tax=Microbacterium sp. Yaish 1 TaxID=2025014 RepID=UPI000B94228F|nr:EamA family transporter [Microbacterium sp. Yaish 1]OYC96165.1 EamA family transporter [Microbacterium sp. Yaish 1]